MKGLKWLRVEAPAGQAMVVVFYSLLLLGLFDLIARLAITALHIPFTDQNLARNTQWASSFPHSVFGFLGLLAGLVYYALEEETLLRFAPLTLVTRFWPMPTAVIATSILSSAVFGYLHGGAAYILVRGIPGLIYCGVFLKCGGWSRGWSRPFRALFFSTLGHFLHNALVATPIFWGWRTM
jgi:membrane protease YdiL (CAAX protease family)